MKRLVVILTLAVFSLILSACLPSPKQAYRVKNQTPLAEKLIKENTEVFDILLEIKNRVIEYGDEELIIDGQCYTIQGYSIRIGDVISFKPYIKSGLGPATGQPDTEYVFLTAEEQEIISNVFLNKLEGKCDERFIIIESNGVYFRYLNSGWANLAIENPARDVPEYDSWEWYEYAVKVNDDWGIHIFQNRVQG